MNRLLHKLFGGREDAPSRPIIVVSGLPRSGTSMMMKMLEVGGLRVFVDNLRMPDPDNPEGYYEFERVKKLDKGDTAWVGQAQGQVVKVISALLEHLPPEYTYQALFMQRDIHEVLASQKKMLQRRGEAVDKVSDEEMAALFAKHVAKTAAWLHVQPNFQTLWVDYNQLLADPQPQIQAVNRFLGGALDEAKMADVVNPDLYRNRA